MTPGSAKPGALRAQFSPEGAAAQGAAVERTCVGCRRKASPEELVRVVAGPEGSLLVGRTLPGRGAWLCAGSLRCVQRAAQRNALARALRAPVSPEAVLALGQVIPG